MVDAALQSIHIHPMKKTYTLKSDSDNHLMDEHGRTVLCSEIFDYGLRLKKHPGLNYVLTVSDEPFEKAKEFEVEYKEGQLFPYIRFQKYARCLLHRADDILFPFLIRSDEPQKLYFKLEMEKH